MTRPSTIAVAALVLFSVVAGAAELTEQTVRELVARADQAASTRDVAPIAEMLSDDVVIDMTIHINGRTQTMRPSKDEYLAMLEEGWAAASDYRYDRHSLDIRIESARRARVSAEVTESMSVGGQYITGTTREEAIIELVQGRPQVTRLNSTSSVVFHRTADTREAPESRPSHLL